jgi:hypothetical protein
MEVKMSSYQQTRTQKRAQKYQNLTPENDISTQEFDSYYQRCLQNKKLRLDNKLLNTEQFSEEETNTEVQVDKDKEADCEWSHTFDMEYEEYCTNEEIDRAFEEAERWADF